MHWLSFDLRCESGTYIHIYIYIYVTGSVFVRTSLLFVIASSKASLWLTLIIPFNFFPFTIGIIKDCVAIYNNYEELKWDEF